VKRRHGLNVKLPGKRKKNIQRPVWLANVHNTAPADFLCQKGSKLTRPNRISSCVPQTRRSAAVNRPDWPAFPRRLYLLLSPSEHISKKRGGYIARLKSKRLEGEGPYINVETL